MEQAKVFSFTAGANIARFDVVALSANNTVVTADGSKTAIGVAYTEALAGEAVAVVAFGQTEVNVGEALTFGKYFGTNATGKAVEATAGELALGYIVEGAATGRAVAMVVAPFMVPGGIVAGVTTDATLTGDGTVADPIGLADTYLTAVAVDTTLTGDGTVASPLSVVGP